jgi:hypothetical protein
MLFHAITLLSLLVLLWASRKRTRRIVVRRSIAAGFLLYFVFWMLFCWSEWQPEYGAMDLLLAIFSSAMVGLIGALAFGVLSAAIFWAYQIAANE